MLYNKKNEKELTNDLFASPTAEFRGAPFWAWNTKLNDEMLTKQIEIFKEMGIGGFHMHVRTGMETTYLSDEFFHFIKLCNEKAKKENMLCWLYDEDRWPSGAAGGYVTKNRRLRQHYLTFSKNDPHRLSNGDYILAESYEEFVEMCARGEKTLGYYLKKYDIVLDEGNYLKEYREITDDSEAKGDIWYVTVRISGDNGWYNGQGYLDTLSKEAVNEFVNTTYEAYYREVGSDFGKSIPAIFTDEPQFIFTSYLPSGNSNADVNKPWTDDFEETYKKTYGESIIDKLPELVWEKRDSGCARTRYTYLDHVSERFVSAFVDTIGQWCKKHNIAFTGHMMQEPTLWSQTSSIGDAMRCYRNFQIPGMDLLCDEVELTTAKQVQSTVHQYGREGMLSELYGVTGWDFPFKGHKRQGDWQAALGVTVRVHHLTWVSMNGDAKRDYPASIGYQSPWYKEYKTVEDHFARVNTALTRGTPCVRVGVIHPIESYWLYTGPNDLTALKRNYLDEQFRGITKALCNSGVDFDFISESLLPSLCEKGTNPLAVGEMKYDYIIVPVMETMRSTTLDRLNGFVKEGGKVILVGKAPERVDAVLSDKALLASSAWDKIDVDYSTLIDRLAPVRFVDFTDINLGTRCDDFVHQLRNDGDSKWLFLCHSEDLNKRRQHMPTEKYENVRIKLNGSFDVTEYNTVTGEIYTPAYEIKNGKTYLTYKLFTEDSLLLKLTPANEDKIVSGNAPRILLPFTSNTPVIKLPDDNGFTLDEPNSVLLDMCNYAFDGEEYTSEKVDSARIGDLGRARFYTKHQSQTSIQPWVPVPDELKNDSGHTVKRKFEFDTEIDIKGAYIALEMSDTARIFINGNEIEKKYCGWYVDECIVKVALPEIKKGHVTVEIETPFTLRGRTEWCYILGNFGVILSGKHLVVTDMPQTLAYGDITRQLLPFFTGNITYHIPFVEKDGTLPRTLQLTDFGGALAGVRLDGRDMGRIFISPFCIDLGTVTKGEHTLEITVFGTRFNNFGPIHNNVQGFRYLGPNSWKTYDSPSWNDNYLVKPAGILNNPVIY